MSKELTKQQGGTGGDRADRPKRQRTRGNLPKIAQLAVDKFLENPSAFWSFSPELANAIEQHLQASSRSRKRVPVFEGYMTEREREYKLGALEGLVQRHKTTGSLSPDEAHQALALAAALRDHGARHKNTLLEIVERVLGLSLDSTKHEKLVVLKGKAEHHTVDLVLGVTLSLAWDGALLAITLEPEAYQRRKRALSFVGMAADTETDVAENHDRYLWDVADAR